VQLLLGGASDTPIACPDYTYDTTLPSIKTLTIHSGNPRSDTLIGINNTITIRLQSEGPIKSVSLDYITIGGVEVQQVKWNASMNQMTGEWNIQVNLLPSYVLSNSSTLHGEFAFAYTIVNEWGNTVRQVYTDSRMTVDLRQPRIELVKVRSSSVRNPTRASRGDSVDLTVTSSAPLRYLTLTSFTIASTFLDVSETPVMAVGRYPTSTFKIVQTIPVTLANITGPIHFELAGVGMTGNPLAPFSDIKSPLGVMDGYVFVV